MPIRSNCCNKNKRLVNSQDRREDSKHYDNKRRMFGDNRKKEGTNMTTTHNFERECDQKLSF